MILKCLFIDTVDASFLTLPPSYEAGFLDAETIRRYAAQPDTDMPESFVRRALAANDECFAIRQGDRLAAYGWYSSSANHFSEEHTLYFNRQWVYMYRGFTHPEHRGRRLHAVGMTRALAAYQARGFKGLVSCVEARNHASLTSVFRMGYRVFGTIYGVRLASLLGLRRPAHHVLNRQLVFCTPGCRRFGFWLERNARAATDGAPEPLKA